MDPSPQDVNLEQLRNHLSESHLPQDFKLRLSSQLQRLDKVIRSQGYKIEFDKEIEYIRFATSLPFATSSEDILDLHRAKEILDKNHYGLQLAKDRILEYLSVLILNSRAGRKAHSQVLAFVGLVGSGKTSLAYSIAESLGRIIIRIPFGGLGSVAMLRGQSRATFEAEVGIVLKGIARAQVNNPVILLDELDRVDSLAKADIMGLLVELLDPEQNFAFLDHYLDYPFDLSKVLFITTANNTSNIATAVLDRLEIIEMPAYSDLEKITIGKNFILPKALNEAGVNPGLLSIDDSLWPNIVRPLGFDAGIRSLQRHIQGIVRKVARKLVEGDNGPFRITAENIEEYIE